jgi:hypothetical protein
MNIPSFTFVKRTSVFALVILAVAIAVSAQTAEVAWNIDQCANGKRGTPREACTGSNWVNGNLNESKSQYSEGDSVAFRIIITGLTPGSTGNTVTVEYDPTKAGKSAYDYLTTWNRTETGDPCNGVATCNLGINSTFPIPIDPRVTRGFDDSAGTADDIVQIPGVFTLYGGTITAVSGYTLTSGSYASDSSKSITITYTAGATSTAVLAWGGHIASRLDWGVDNAAPDINGSPYHMRVLDGGNQDRSLKIPIQAFPAKLTIIKQIGDDPTLTSNLFFGFDKSDVGTAGNADFFLQDTYATAANPGDPARTDAIVFNYELDTGATATVNITELAVGFGWGVSHINCVDSNGGFGFTQNSTPNNSTTPFVLGDVTAVARIQSAEFVTCTFQNLQGNATAAPVELGGRVTTSFGRAIANAELVLTDTATGAVRTARTNTFGYYRFDNISTTAFYSLSVSSKRYVFRDSTQYFTLSEDNLSMNFVSAN